MKETKLFIRDIILSVVIVIIIMQFVSPTIVKGESMANTLHGSDYLIISKFNKEKITYGDIIVFKTDLLDEDDDKKKLIKRVIGLPGDIMEIKDGQVYKNHKAIDEEYIKDGCTEGEYNSAVVPDGKVFVLGDNRQCSSDSRDSSVGMVDTKTIIGKAVYRVFPFDNFGRVN